MVRPPVLRPIAHDYPIHCPHPRKSVVTVLRKSSQRSCVQWESVPVRGICTTSLTSSAGPTFESTLVSSSKFSNGSAKLKACPSPRPKVSVRRPRFEELQSEWESMLAHQLRALPPFDQFWAEVPRIFAWLNGKDQVDDVGPVPLDKGEEHWVPPHIFWESGQGSLLKPVRFAAVNRLLVRIRYRGNDRLIEPYSLRLTTSGDVLLRAVSANSGVFLQLRVNRIRSATVTSQPFTPRFTIEFPG